MDDELSFNPHARVEAELDANGVPREAYRVVAPIRGQALRESSVARAEDPALYDLLTKLVAAGADVEIAPGSSNWEGLLRLGLFIPEAAVAERVEVSIDPLETPWPLVPRAPAHDADLEGPVSDELIVDPTLVVQRDENLPPALAARVRFLPQIFTRQCPLVWIEEPTSRCMVPYRVSPMVANQLRPGMRAPDLPDAARHAYMRAGILVEPRRPPRGAPSDPTNTFSELGMMPIAEMIPPVHLAFLRRYYERRLEEGFLPLRRAGTEARFVAHNEPMSRFWLGQLTEYVGRMAKAAVKPAYVYFSSYVPGSTLPRHVDRGQCEYSVTLLVDYRPEPIGESPWPLLVEGRDGKVSRVFQRVGNALLYRGRELPHAREELPAGHRSTHLFFHYVDESYDGPLE